jgi:hypothetical protein
VTNPGLSCLAILNGGGSTGDGVYWINPMNIAYQVYCNMTTSGGGWTMVLMAADNATTFDWDSAYWTNTTTVNPGTVDPTQDVDVKSSAFNDISFTAMNFCLGTITQCVAETVTATSAVTVFQGGSQIDTSKTITNFAVWQNFSGWYQGCQRAGFDVQDTANTDGKPASVRYGILLNNEATCEGSVDGAIGFGTRGYFGTETSAGSGDGVIPISYRRGWIFVR